MPTQLSFIFLLFFTISFIGLASCTGNSKKNPISRILTQRPDGNPDPNNTNNSQANPTKCKRQYSDGENLTLRELDFINSKNIGEYVLKGRCSQSDLLVYIEVNGYKISTSPKCNKKRWEVTLDLTPLSQNETAIFRITHNNETLCNDISIAFLGPQNYISIASRDGYYESAFYVMKYEAKLQGQGYNAKAVSEPENRPISQVSYQEALQLCKNNGSRYDLITNEQWQNIALDIEEVDENWLDGRARPSDGNQLNCGIFRGAPQPASKNDQDDCGSSHCDSDWDLNKRTHLLSSGDRIWDMCGNVGEVVKTSYRLNEEFDDYVYKLHSNRKLAQLFAPRRSYHSLSSRQRGNNWNLGYAKIKQNRELIIRGLPGRESGIFSVDVTNHRNSRRLSTKQVGFRCIYNP